MNYSEAIQFLYGLNLFGANFGLENTFRLAARGGNPQTQLRFIHVAGTNGKGSTCAMLESIYRAAGLRVGLFTSPHLVSFRERIQVNRRLISEADVARLVAEVAAGILPAVEPGFQPGEKSMDAARRIESSKAVAFAHASPGGWKPPAASGRMPDATTLFEFVTVMALKYFAEQKCDLVIWETGLGGRLDATNIVTPLASVITNIALDHTQWLGDTLEKIAAEKAGIIKPGVPVLTAATEPEVLAVIENTAQAKGTTVTVVGQASRLSSSSRQSQSENEPTGAHPSPGAAISEQRMDCNCSGAGGALNVAAPEAGALRDRTFQTDTLGKIISQNTNWTGWKPVLLHLSGEHQKLNAALALATVEVLQKQIPVGEDQIRAGLQTVDWPGRMQLITRPNGQKILLDGAHNLAGAKALRAALDKDFSDAQPTLIFGALADKDWAGICHVLAPLAAKIFTVPVASGRTADAGELAKVFQAANPVATVTALDSLTAALAASQHEPFVAITGSLYLIGEALERLGHSPTKTDERGLNEWTTAKNLR